MVHAVRKRRPTPATIIAVVALVVATTGVAAGAIPDSATGEITACVNPGGHVRFIDAEDGASCRSEERAVTFNQQGEPGLSELERVVQSTTFSSDFVRSVTATCPAGKKVVGSSFNIDGQTNAAAGEIQIDEVVPSADLQSVRALAFEIRPGTEAVWRLSAIAICAKVAD